MLKASADLRLPLMTISSMALAAARGTPSHTYLHLATYFRVCNFPCRAATFGSRTFAISGSTLLHWRNCGQFVCAISIPVRNVATLRTAPDVPDWLIWKEIFADRRQQTARSPMHALACLPPPCSGRRGTLLPQFSAVSSRFRDCNEAL